MAYSDIVHQAQNVYDKFNKAPLLPTHSHKEAEPPIVNSVLTNIAPPVALPSFIAPPLPPTSPNVLPPIVMPVNVGSTEPVQPNASGGPVISQPTPTSDYVRGHSRHHSFPLYFPTGPSQTLSKKRPSFSPIPPTPPCSVMHNNPFTNATVGNYSSSFNIDSYSASNYNYYNSNPATQMPDSASLNMDSGLYSPTKEQQGWMGWIKGTVSSVGSKVAERAKTSMDTVITTLDPQMKELIHSGGDIDIFVASDKEVKVGAVREAFQTMFGKATVNGIAVEGGSVAAQPVGVEAALQSAEERINNLRATTNVHPQQPVLAVENFIVEFAPDSWFDLGVILLDDPWHDIILQTFTQMTPVPLEYVNQARANTPSDYALKSTGFSTTIGQIASQVLQVHHTQWQETLCGVPRRDMIHLAAKSLAGLYKSKLPQAEYKALPDAPTEGTNIQVQ